MVELWKMVFLLAKFEFLMSIEFCFTLSLSKVSRIEYLIRRILYDFYFILFFFLYSFIFFCCVAFRTLMSGPCAYRGWICTWCMSSRSPTHKNWMPGWIMLPRLPLRCSTWTMTRISPPCLTHSQDTGQWALFSRLLYLWNTLVVHYLSEPWVMN